MYALYALYHLLQVNDSLLSLLLADEREGLKITATGLKLFERHELRGKEIGKCQYRIAQVTNLRFSTSEVECVVGWPFVQLLAAVLRCIGTIPNDCVVLHIASVQEKSCQLRHLIAWCFAATYMLICSKPGQVVSGHVTSCHHHVTFSASSGYIMLAHVGGSV